jgi:hypothetical protein
MTRNEMTISEADAWRAGWEAAQAQAVGAALQAALHARAHPMESCEDHTMAKAYDLLADVLSRLEMPAPRVEPTGMEYRGG